jgi:hypothetical protein
VLGQRTLRARRRRAFAALEKVRGTRLIAIIHRQETVGVLGVPFYPQLGDLPAAAIVRVATNKPLERVGPDKAETIAEELAGGHYTHDDPITVAEARAFGLPVSTGLPREAYDLMELYPQEGRRRPSVQFVPLPDPAADSQRRS